MPVNHRMRIAPAAAYRAAESEEAHRDHGDDHGDQRRQCCVAADAYFTVEAALVIPVILCIFVMIMYLSFYLYDRCIMAQDCYVVSYRQSIEKGGADRAGREAVRSQYGQKLFMLQRLESSSSTGGTIRVRSNASMDPPLVGLDLSGSERKWILGVEEKARRTDPPKDYRRVRRLLYLAGRAADAAGGQQE